MSLFAALTGDGHVGLVLDPVSALAIAQLIEDADLAGVDADRVRELRLAAHQAGPSLSPAFLPKPSRAHLRVVGGDSS